MEKDKRGIVYNNWGAQEIIMQIIQDHNLTDI